MKPHIPDFEHLELLNEEDLAYEFVEYLLNLDLSLEKIDPEIIGTFIDLGVPLNARCIDMAQLPQRVSKRMTGHGYVTPFVAVLHYRSMVDYYPAAMVKLLQICIEHGLDVTIPSDKDNKHLIHYWAEMGPTFPSSYDILVKAGARLDEMDDSGKYPLHYLLYRDNVFNLAINTILELGSPVDGPLNLDSPAPLLFCAYHASYEKLDILLKSGADPNIYDDLRLPLIFEVANHTHSNVYVRSHLLLKHGANINFQDHGYSLFDAMIDQYNVHKSNYDFASRLDFILINGFNANITNTDGDTPLHLIAKNYSTGALLEENGIGEKLVGILLSYGANPLMKNKKGLTPYDIAPELRSHLL